MITLLLLACGARAPSPAFDVRCGLDGESSECAVLHRGNPVGDPLWSWTGGAGLLQPVGGLHLAATYAGDGCPTLYVAYCEHDGKPLRSELFGTCDEAATIDASDGVVLRFTGWEAEGMARRSAIFRVDPASCAVSELPAVTP